MSVLLPLQEAPSTSYALAIIRTLTGERRRAFSDSDGDARTRLAPETLAVISLLSSESLDLSMPSQVCHFV